MAASCCWVVGADDDDGDDDMVFLRGLGEKGEIVKCVGGMKPRQLGEDVKRRRRRRSEEMVLRLKVV